MQECPADRKGTGVGSVWTWAAIDADSKLIISYAVGDRDAATALQFMLDSTHIAAIALYFMHYNFVKEHTRPLAEQHQRCAPD